MGKKTEQSRVKIREIFYKKYLTEARNRPCRGPSRQLHGVELGEKSGEQLEEASGISGSPWGWDECCLVRGPKVERKPWPCSEEGLGTGIWRLQSKEEERGEVEEGDVLGIYKRRCLSSKIFAYSTSLRYCFCEGVVVLNFKGQIKYKKHFNNANTKIKINIIIYINIIWYTIYSI